MGWMDRGLNTCGLGYLNTTNERYLDSAFDRSLTGFLLLSTIKSGLAVVEGSEVGIGFNLELGDIVQPIYDYVDIAWRVALAGGSIIIGMQLALKGLRVIDQWALAIMGLMWVAYYLSSWYCPGKQWLSNGFRDAARFGVSLCLAVYLLLPLSVTGAAALSLKITQPVITTAHEELKAIGSNLSPTHISQHFLSNNDNGQGLSVQDLKSALANAGRGVRAFITYLKTETEHMATLTIQLVAAYLFDCILFPLLFAFIFLTVLKSGLRRIFEIKQPRNDHIP